MDKFMGRNLWEVDDHHAQMDLLCEMVKIFRQQYPDKNPFLPSTIVGIKNMTTVQFLSVLEWGAPKLSWLHDRLDEIVQGQGKKVILWVYWSLSQ